MGAKQTAEGFAAIKKNYPDATPELARERALTKEGVHLAVAMLTQVAQIAVDYLPGSSAASEGVADQKVGEVARNAVHHLVENARGQALALGFSDFGALAMPLINSVALASLNGTNVFRIYRALLDCVDFAASHRSDAPVREEQVVEFLAKQMQISKAAARKYVRAAKDLPPGWDS